jgi:putative methionine-R-sulfoxide reductase with GAF domain
MTPQIQKLEATNKREFYNGMIAQTNSIIDTSLPIVSNLSNLSSYLYYSFQDQSRNINWLGFYVYNDQELLLGPFQGRIACTRIRMGKGVCGTSALEKRTIRVKDVTEFKGHIACDSKTKSEIVLPIVVDDVMYGVLDIDSLDIDEFDQEDQDGLELVVKEIVQMISKYKDPRSFIKYIKS